MSELKIGKMTMGVCQTNCYFLYREGSFDAVFVDPADQGGAIYDALSERGFKVAAILLTHGHFDHIWGVRELKEKSGAKLYAYEGERELCGDSGLNVSKQVGRPCTVAGDVDVWLKDGEEVTAAGMICSVIATPGHTQGSCCYYFKAEKPGESGFLISGDTLFQESVGRTDFPTGSMGQIVRSIQDKLFTLPDETKVYPGHGESTTIGYEKQYNPYCQ